MLRLRTVLKRTCCENSYQPSSMRKLTVPSLTPRERGAVQLLAEGKSTKEVACHLNLSVKTAETHRSNLMRKIGLHSISELILYAVRNGIIQVVVGLAFSRRCTGRTHRSFCVKPISVKPILPNSLSARGASS